jgi:hypothetical protein
MGRTLTAATNISVLAPNAIYTSFGNGSDVGTIAGSRWTPGRDAQGRINQVSWATVPTGRWLSVGGSRLDSLDAAVKRFVPAFADYGVEGWKGVTDDWCGFAIDETNSRAWLLGGGHAGSSNNGLYRLDFFRMMWDIEALPSDPSAWSLDYRQTGRRGGTFTYCKESDDVYKRRLADGTLNAIDDVFSDELFWDSRPAARHTYSSMVYVPEKDEVVMVCRRLWRYSIAQRKWVQRRFIRDQLDAKFMDGENIVATFDERRGEVLASSAGSSGTYRATGYDVRSGKWTDWSSPWNLYADVADARWGRRLTVISPPKQAGGGYGTKQGLYWEYDLDTRMNATQGTLQYAPGLGIQDFVAVHSWYDGAALAYLPELNRYWLLTKMADGSHRLLVVDPTTNPWTLGPFVPFGSDGKVGIVNPERKMVYVPALKAVVLVTSADQDAFLYRLA